MTSPTQSGRSDADGGTISPLEVRVVDLGADVDYEAALETQRRAVEDVIARRAAADSGDGGGMTLFLVEHAPVITISKRRGVDDHLLATEAQLEAEGVTVARTDRGGDITYHGPGQLVIYPIVDLNRLGLRLHGYMRFLEGIVIDLLAGFGVTGRRDACATGVWVDGYDIDEVSDGKGHLDNDPTRPLCAAGFRGHRKICAMGVRVSRWVTMHGLALNVEPNLRHFQLIVPCGLADRPVTSLAAERARDANVGPPTMDEVKVAAVACFEQAINAQLAESSPVSRRADVTQI